MINKKQFDDQVISYQVTLLYKNKTQVYKEGFVDGISLAWSIIEEHARQHTHKKIQREPKVICSFDDYIPPEDMNKK